MKILVRSFLIMLLSLSTQFVAIANSMQDARTALDTGLYDQAASIAKTLGTSASLTLGAEALNAQLLLGDGSKKSAKKAMKMAKAALEINPNNQDAQMQYTLAYGYYGRAVSDFTAFRKKLPKKTRIEILKNLEANPKHPYAYALMGAWHLSIVNRGGAKRGKKMFGADIQTGRKYFEDALIDAPNDILLNANYASMMYALAPNIHKDWAIEKFILVTKTKARTQLERKIQMRIQAILEALDHDTERAQELAQKFAFG